jgi:hypothetical protein
MVTQNEAQTMAKVQKTWMVPEDVHRVLHTLEEHSGASFSRVLLAATLAYLFECFKHPEPHSPKVPDPLWIRLAVLVERGEIGIGDIPAELLDTNIESAELFLRGQETSDDPLATERRQRIKNAKEIKKWWESDVETTGGKVEAIVDALTRAYKWADRPSVHHPK